MRRLIDGISGSALSAKWMLITSYGPRKWRAKAMRASAIRFHSGGPGAANRDQANVVVGERRVAVDVEIDRVAGTEQRARTSP